MSNTISVRIEHASTGRAAGQRSHDLRDEREIPDYVDISKSHMNSIVIAPPHAETTRLEIEVQRKIAGQQVLRKDARTSILGVITFGKDAQHGLDTLSRVEQDAIFERVARRIEKETGNKLLGLVIHRDETALHAHFSLRGYRRQPDGQEMPARFSRAFLAHIQDAAGEEVAALGISRGKSKALRVAEGEGRAKHVHRSVQELHGDLPRELEALKKQRDESAANLEKTQERLRVAMDKCKSAEEAQAVLEKRVRNYESRAQNAEKTLQKLQNEIARLEKIPQFQMENRYNNLKNSVEIVTGRPASAFIEEADEIPIDALDRVQIEFRGAFLHVLNEDGHRRYAWLPMTGGEVWQGTRQAAMELIETLGMMTRGARAVDAEAAPETLKRTQRPGD